MYRFNQKQLNKLVFHLSEVTEVLMDISGLKSEPEPEPETDVRQEPGEPFHLELNIELELPGADYTRAVGFKK